MMGLILGACRACAAVGQERGAPVQRPLPESVPGTRIHLFDSGEDLDEVCLVDCAARHLDELVLATASQDATVRILDPAVTGLSLTGAIVEVGAEITALKQSGSVDFMTCRDLRVNGIAIEIEEYAYPFAFKEGEKITLPTPAKISIKIGNLAKAAYKELTDPKKDWAVTGTVFVFGKFRKFGFNFKRVVPVKINLTIKNPLNSIKLDSQ